MKRALFSPPASEGAQPPLPAGVAPPSQPLGTSSSPPNARRHPTLAERLQQRREARSTPLASRLRERQAARHHRSQSLADRVQRRTEAKEKQLLEVQRKLRRYQQVSVLVPPSVPIPVGGLAPSSRSPSPFLVLF